jgi:hypothetical protein
MSELQDIEYKVVLVFPGFGEERDNAEQIIEEALHYLNTQKDEPGMRFAQNVFAQLEIVMDADQAWSRLESDDDLAMLILHDLSDEEKEALTLESLSKEIPVCHTMIPEYDPDEERRPPRPRKREWQVVIRKRKEDDEPPAHKIAETTLTAPLDGDPDEVGDRIGQLIAVMALGVMEHHWRRNPPNYEIYNVSD